MSEPIVITRLKVHNFLGLEDYDVEPAPGVNVVSGANGSGKTSLLQAIVECLEGGRKDRWLIHRKRDGSLSAVPAEGDTDDDAAEIMLWLSGGMKVHRRITDDKSEVQVTKKEGGLDVSQRPSQKVLDELLGTGRLDPVEFYRAPRAEQKRILLSLVPEALPKSEVERLVSEVGAPTEAIGELPDLLGLDQFKLVEERLLERRKAAFAEKEFHEEAAKAEAEKLPVGYDPVKEPVVEIDAIMGRLDEANATQAAVADARHWLDATLAVRDRAKGDTARAEQAAAEAVRRAETEREQVKFNTERAIERATKEVSRIQAEIERLTRQLDSARLQIGNDERAGAIDLENANEAVAEAKRKGEADVKKAEAEVLALDDRVTTAQESLNAKTAAATDPAPVKGELAEREERRMWRAAHEASAAHVAEREIRAELVRACDQAVRSVRFEAPRLLWDRLDSTPLRGLDVGMEGDRITVGGVDMDRLSTSEQARFAVRVAYAVSGRIKVLIVDGFESLDPKVQGDFFDQASKSGFQHFIAVVSDGGLEVTAR